MNDEMNRVDSSNNTNIYIAFVLGCVLVLLTFYIYNYTNIFSNKNPVSKSEVASSSVFSEILVNEDLKTASNFFSAGQYKDAYEKFNRVLADENFSDNKNVVETTELYRIAAQIKFDRDAGLLSYYNFFRDVKNSNINRAYAAIMAAQDTIANNDVRRMVQFLSNQEVAELKEITHDEVLYALDKKIFAIYPFPLSGTRLAMYEINKVNKSDKDYANKVNDIRTKYLYRYDENIKEMLNYEGQRHLVPNSLGSKSLLENLLEDAKLIGATTTTRTLEQAYEYAQIYSGKPTKHFLMMTFLDHEIKINNIENVEKILKMFRYTGNEGGDILSDFVKNRFKTEQDFKKFYPYVYKKYTADKEFAKILDQIIK